MRRYSLVSVASLLLSAVLLVGCEGDKGDPGPQGPAGGTGQTGAPGTPGVPAAGSGIPIASVNADKERLDAAIQGVTVPAGGGQPVVNFTLKNRLGQPVSGLPAANIRFTLGTLTAGTGGSSSAWRSYIVNASGQGTAEVATAGTLEEVAAGTYRYTFSKALTAYGGTTYDGALRHRVGFEVRQADPITGTELPVNNATFDFAPSGGAMTVSREIVDNDTCNACHDVLEFHGGARFDTQYCVACHNPQSVDNNAPNASVDMKVMIHKIHGRTASETNPDDPVTVTTDYVITGFGNVVYNFGEVEYPQDPRNCQTCHEETDTDTPEASNWRLVPTREACGSCHDGLMSNPLNPGTGTMTHPGGLVLSDDTQCAGCHGPSSTVTNTAGKSVQVASAHQIPLAVESAKFAYNLVSVTDTSGGPLEDGDTPRVTISVTNPTNNNAPYDIKQAGGPFASSSAALRVDLAWTSKDFSNMLNPANTASTAPFQPLSLTFANGATPVAAVVNNGNGTFTLDSTVPLPVKASLFPGAPAYESGALVALVEGRPRVDTNGDGTLDASAQVAGVGGPVAWNGVATARRRVVEITRCNQCHEVLSLHGGNRTDNTELCSTCHNPNATDIRQRSAGACAAIAGPTALQAPLTGASPDVSIDFRYMIHAIHSGPNAQYVVCGNGNSVHDYSHVHYPGKLNNCEGCHVPPTSSNPSYYGLDPSTTLAVSTDAGASRTVLTDDLAMTPTTAACAGCHTNNTALTHMKQNGGALGAAGDLKTADGAVSTGAETCALCHGPGRTADTREVHGVGLFQYNSSN